MSVRVLWVARSPGLRRRTRRVAVTARRLALSARRTPFDGLSVTFVEPAPAQRTVPRASVRRLQLERLRVALETVSVAVPDIASVHVTWTDSPRAPKPASVVGAGLVTPNQAA